MDLLRLKLYPSYDYLIATTFFGRLTNSSVYILYGIILYVGSQGKQIPTYTIEKYPGISA